MKKRMIRFSLWFLGLAATAALFGFVNHQRRNLICSGAEVNILGDSSLHFISEDEVLELIRNHGVAFAAEPVESVNTMKAESLLKAHPAIADADVYFNIEGKLKLDITQREPLLRIIDITGESYYIDKQGNYMPMIPAFTALVPVATGFITDPWHKFQHNISELMQNDSLEKQALVDDLFVIAEQIAKDTLLSAQLVQLNVRPDKDIEMIPRVGTGVVLLGDKSDLDAKLRHLNLFYSKAAQLADLNQYSQINLKYQNQIICTKSTQ